MRYYACSLRVSRGRTTRFLPTSMWLFRLFRFMHFRLLSELPILSSSQADVVMLMVKKTVILRVVQGASRIVEGTIKKTMGIIDFCSLQRNSTTPRF